MGGGCGYGARMGIVKGSVVGGVGGKEFGDLFRVYLFFCFFVYVVFFEIE